MDTQEKSQDRHDRRRHHQHTRSRSPRRPDQNRRHDRKHRERSPPARPVTLPFKARQLTKHDYKAYKPLFHSYLDIQKQLNLDELDEREAEGRWKSFISRWNRGDLARSWYDPAMLKTAQDTVSEYRARSPMRARRASPDYSQPAREPAGEDSDSDEDFGPAPPRNADGHRSGPTIPRLDDIALRDELREEDRQRDGLDYRDDMRHLRKQDRKAQKERLEELVPRADPGSRERQLEKKRETTNTLSEFRDAKEGGDVEMAEADLMGDDGGDGFKRQKKDMERKKNERELRREEIMRARAAEREERLAAGREKENATMEYLRAIARDRFG